MMMDLKETVAAALDKSIKREGTSSELETRDLLSVVESKGDIYKFKIVRALLINKARKKIDEKQNKDMKSLKQE